MYKTPAQMVHTTPTRPRPRWCTQHQQDPGPDGAHNTNKTPAQMVHTTPTRPRPRWCTQHQQDPGPDGAHNTNKTQPRWCTQHQQDPGPDGAHNTNMLATCMAFVTCLISTSEKTIAHPASSGHIHIVYTK